MTPDVKVFESTPEPCTPKTFRAANKNTFTASRMGTARVNIQGPNPLVLPDVLYVPELANTLISIGCLDDAGYTVTFGGGQGVIRNECGEIVGTIPKSNGLYRLIEEVDGEANGVVEKVTLNNLHRRMGHISLSAARKLVENGFVEGVSLKDLEGGGQCESCIFAKATRKSVPKVRQGKRATTFGEQVHSDVWGPAAVESTSISSEPRVKPSKRS
jgi:hypothetical protein